MKRDLKYYDGWPWRVIIDPERQDDGRIMFAASHPEFDEVLGTGKRQRRRWLTYIGLAAR
jgi:hypothetical protein